MGCPHNSSTICPACAEMIGLGTRDLMSSNNQIWERRLKDGTTLIGVKGDDTHTHIGPDFVQIRNETLPGGLKSGTPIKWFVKP